MSHDLLNRDGVVLRTEQPWADAQLARLYDAFLFEEDLPLYLELAQQQGKRVLEVACGSGRVMLPLARAGFDVVGVDISPPMLALARAKLRRVAEQYGPSRTKATCAPLNSTGLTSISRFWRSKVWICR